MKPSDLRLCAAKIINDVANGQSLSDCLEPVISTIKDSRDRAFVQAVSFGICRFYLRLDIVLSYLLKKPMNAKDSDVHALLLVGLFQLMEMRIPDHAAVSETVNAAEKLKQPWAKGFINAILREYLRNKDILQLKMTSDIEARYNHADWWIKLTKKTWPHAWQTILTQNNEHPPLSLRVNRLKFSRDEYLQLLAAEDIKAHMIAHTADGIIIDEPQGIESLPKYADGGFSVQDGAAQLAADLLELAPELSVLDACAAPGGKLTHIYETEPKLGRLKAVEKEKRRLNIIKDNIQRLQIPLAADALVCADATNADRWWDKHEYDRILLDAPCSASGVVRRHPDIKLLRQLEDIEQLAELQLKLLSTLWPLLKSGGIFLYVTCSIFPQENSDVIAKFLADHTDAEEIQIAAAWGETCEHGQQILPGTDEMDGFYYAKLRKL